MGTFLKSYHICKGKTPKCRHPKFSSPVDWYITPSPRHWSTESTVVEYIQEIFVPYVDSQRELCGGDEAALAIMDYFKGQITLKIAELLDQHNIHIPLLPPNTTDRLQTMDLSVNKPTKDFIRREFEDWYASHKLMINVKEEALQRMSQHTYSLLI